MKKLLVLLAILAAINANAQWQPDVRLTNDTAYSSTSYNNAWCVATSGFVVHVVWMDERDGNNEIYYKRSTNSGLNWSVETRLTNDADGSYLPSVAVSGSVVHIVLNDHRDGNDEIYYKRSTDAGISWGADTRLTNNNAVSTLPSLAVSGSNVHVVWEDNRDGNYELYYKHSTDAGISWGVDTRLTNNTATSYLPSVAVSGLNVHIVWMDNRDGNWEVYYKRSTNTGVSWGADICLTNNNAISLFPCIAVSGSFVHIVWSDHRDGNFELYYKSSTDAGVNWSADIRLTNNNAVSNLPSVAVSGSVVHVVSVDSRDGNDEIYYKRSTDAGVNWGADTRLTNDTGYSSNPSIAVSGSVLHVVWRDYRDGNYEIYYKHDPTGNPIGIQNISTETPSKYSLSQNYPNPFNPTTKIKFDIPRWRGEGGWTVLLQVYDITGREVQTLVNESLKPGTYEATFDGSMLNSGVYFYKLTTDGFTETKRMILLK